MKKILLMIGVVFTSCCLVGFKSGNLSTPSVEKPQSPDLPVTQYREPVSETKTNAQRYQQFHLIAVSSLGEARSALNDNQRWAYRMADDAYRYLQLLKELSYDEHEAAFTRMLERLKPLVTEIDKKTLSGVQKKRIDSGLKEITAVLKNDLNFQKTKTWIKE